MSNVLKWIERYIKIDDLDSQARIGMAIMKEDEPQEHNGEFFHQCYLSTIVEEFSEQWLLLAQHFGIKGKKNLMERCLKFAQDIANELNRITAMPGKYLLVQSQLQNSFGILYREPSKIPKIRLEARKWMENNINTLKIDNLAEKAMYELMRYGTTELKAYIYEIAYEAYGSDIWTCIAEVFDIDSKRNIQEKVQKFSQALSLELNAVSQLKCTLKGRYSLGLHPIRGSYGIYYEMALPKETELSYLDMLRILPRTKSKSERMFGDYSFTDEITTPEEAKSAVEYLSHNEIKFRKELSDEYIDYDKIQLIVRGLWLNLLISCRRVGYSDYIVEAKEKQYKFV